MNERLLKKEKEDLKLYYSRKHKSREWQKEMSNEDVARYLRLLASGEHQVMCPTMVENIVERFKGK